MRDEVHAELVEFLLTAADLAAAGYNRPLTEAVERWGGGERAKQLSIEAREEARAVAPYVFDYCGELLAQTLVEAAYRVADGRGVGGVS
jgi:hypothetical protein